MKARQGLVSNSSSSSFTIPRERCTKEELTIENVQAKLDKIQDSYKRYLKADIGYCILESYVLSVSLTKPRRCQHCGETKPGGDIKVFLSEYTDCILQTLIEDSFQTTCTRDDGWDD